MIKFKLEVTFENFHEEMEVIPSKRYLIKPEGPNQFLPLDHQLFFFPWI
jgi:hypothetical protein